MVVEPAALARWMWQRDHDGPIAKRPANSRLQSAGAEKARDGHLPDQDENARLEQLELGVEPVRAIGHGSGRRSEIAGARAVATGEAAHQRRDVGEASKLFGAREPGAQHPAIELPARPTRERPARFPLSRSWRLPDQEERRSPYARERGVGLGDDAGVDAYVAASTCHLELAQCGRRGTRRHAWTLHLASGAGNIRRMGPTPQQVLDVLATIQDPDLGRDVVSLGMIKELDVSPQGKVSFTFELTTPACPVRDRFKTQAQDLVGDIPGVSEVEVRMTANVRPAFMRPKPSEILPGVKQTIAIASGKGGVGKSTVAVNIAAALRKAGAEVGLLDADIYGPSVPAMTGSHTVPEQVNGRLQPIDAHGLKVMSFGLIYPGEQPTISRGPMVGKAIEAMMVQVDWGRLDYLVIDLPPGTGDASLTLAQAVPLTGVAIVCTPQDVATDIAVKALQMFRKLNVTPLGLIENMSWYICSSCGHRHEIFSHGGAEAAAQRLGVPFLGAIPLEESIREDADSGTPVVISRPESAGARAFMEIASQIAARTSIQSFRQLPVINVR